MSIALESREIGTSRFTRAELERLPKSLIFQSPLLESRVVAAEEEANNCTSSASSTTSSIGKNSELSGRELSDGDNCDEENEVQSAFKGTLDSMDSLEEALPIRRGISNFYNGKSMSFTSLAEASSSSSIKAIAKPENAYTRKRRNLLAFTHMWDKNRSFPLRSNGGGISKRSISTSRSTLALAVAMRSSEIISSPSEDSSSSSNSKSPQHLPPLHPRYRTSHNNLASLQNVSPWRSLSVVDLQHCVYL